MGRGRPTIASDGKPIRKTISKQDKKDLKVLADDFGLLDREDVKEIIETCKTMQMGNRRLCGCIRRYICNKKYL